ncbi:O-methyltransferase [Cochleicola gelatinilyticus]|uniref:Methyltransferase n=1 Tax=Cochleicola gelatinilyticus TaxID=1763537 RepID=A0A167EPT7_9FLAO|nr:class I SAM-dependent methyltransferase [Cochleicola gelatinilyticus]OAB75755.1 methyltransferase [Cochleicola gelatinilyticus]
MYHQIKSYIQFLFSSTNAHGVHSPFVYNLVTKCFYDKKKYKEYLLLKAHRKELTLTSETISVTDFGAGSRVFTSKERQVSAIAKNAGITRKRQRLLFRLSNYFSAETTLELGTSLGMATVALSLGNPSGKISTVEGCPQTATIAKKYFEQFQLQNIELFQEKFESFLTRYKEPVSLVFIDGSHSKEKTLQYFESLLPNITNDSIIIFDDIYWSLEMTAAWNIVCKHPKVTVSIDTFQWGLLFFRKEQKKQHFKIRV